MYNMAGKWEEAYRVSCCGLICLIIITFCVILQYYMFSVKSAIRC